jgi:hypothetical protein
LKVASLIGLVRLTVGGAFTSETLTVKEAVSLVAEPAGLLTVTE